MFRRRPLRNAAIIGGAAAIAHHAGTKSAQQQAAEDAQNRQIAELQAQQAQPQYAAAPQYAALAAPTAPAITDSVVDQLTNLKHLLDSGVLSEAEFDAQKQRILANT
jgi:hypothetical protein